MPVPAGPAPDPISGSSGSSHQGLPWGQVPPAAQQSLGGQAPHAVLSRLSLLGGQRFLWVQLGLGVLCVQDSQGHLWGQEAQGDPWALEGLEAQWVPGASGCWSQ